MKIVEKIKAFIERLKLKRIAIVAVIFTQALKRFIQSKHVEFVMEIAPLPWVNFLGKLLGYFKKAEVVIPSVVKGLVLAHGMLDEDTATDDQITFMVLADHVRYFSEEDSAKFWQEYALAVMNALAGDGVVDDQERKAINDEAYKRLIKKE